MGRLTGKEKKSIEKQMSVPAERGPVWQARPTVFEDKRQKSRRRRGKEECRKALREER